MRQLNYILEMRSCRSASPFALAAGSKVITVTSAEPRHLRGGYANSNVLCWHNILTEMMDRVIVTDGLNLVVRGKI